MSTNYVLDLNQTGRKFPHYWEMCVGSCHAATLLRQDVQEHLKKAHDEIGFQYVRFHGLFDDDMSVVIAPMIPGLAEPRLSFFNIDRIFDFLLSIGMKPFIELGFMPEAYASGKMTGFHYKNNVTLPKNYDDWENLITAFAKHLEDRYGKTEVRSWYFEVWNEPNLRFFFDGTMEDYFRLYEVSAHALKNVDERLKVGGPATSNNMWIPEFREFCQENNVPCDFITTHHYPSDDPLSTAGMNGRNTKGTGFLIQEEITPEVIEQIRKKFSVKRENKNPRDVLYQMTVKAKKESGDLPLYYTEWNVGHYDEPYAAAGIAMTLAMNENLVEGYSYWCVSDIFEEQGLQGLPFHNEFGLLNVYGIEKPSYRMFEVLHHAGDERLRETLVSTDAEIPVELLVLQDESCTTVIAYNHDIESGNNTTQDVNIHLKGGHGAVTGTRIDASHTNPKAVWEEQGSPDYPNTRQLLEMKTASQLVYETVKCDDDLTFSMEPESVVIFKIERK